MPEKLKNPYIAISAAIGLSAAVGYSAYALCRSAQPSSVVELQKHLTRSDYFRCPILPVRLVGNHMEFSYTGLFGAKRFIKFPVTNVCNSVANDPDLVEFVQISKVYSDGAKDEIVLRTYWSNPPIGWFYRIESNNKQGNGIAHIADFFAKDDKGKIKKTDDMTHKGCYIFSNLRGDFAFNLTDQSIVWRGIKIVK